MFSESANSVVVEVLDELKAENAELKAIVSEQQRMMNEIKVQMQ